MNFFKTFKVAVRQLFRKPGLTVAALLCLALAIGGITALFSLLNFVLFRPLPFEEPDQLARMFVSYEGGYQYGSFSYPEYRNYQEFNDVYSDLMAEQVLPVSLGQGNPERLWGSIVSGNYFSGVGAQTEIGRFFQEREDEAAEAVVVLGHDLWERRFGSDRGIVGRSVDLNGRSFTVVGVAEEGFKGTIVGLAPEVWVPMGVQPTVLPGSDRLEARGQRWLFLLGRLKDGATIAEARQDMNQIEQRLGEMYAPEPYEGSSVTVMAYGDTRVPPTIRDAFYGLVGVLGTVVGLVLLVACANVAGLLLVRASARRREMGIRLSLGATGKGLIGQLMTESVVLGLIGGLGGLLIAFLLVQLLQIMPLPTEIPFELDLSMDIRVLGFALFVSVLTGILFGLAPALQAARSDLVSVIKEDAPGGGSGRPLFRRALVVGQVAVTLVLLVGSGLFLRSLQKSYAIDPGYRVDDIVVGSVNLGLQGYDEARSRSFFRETLDRIEALPEVESVAMARTAPLGIGTLQMSVTPLGYQLPPDGSRPLIDYNVVSPGYFETMGIPILRGRAFYERDTAEAPAVAVVDEALAERLWPGESAIGKQASMPGYDFEVVGIASDAQQRDLGAPSQGYLYLPYDQHFNQAATFHVRTRLAPEQAISALRREVVSVDSNVPLFDVKTLSEHMAMSLLPARLGAAVLTAFGVLGLVLASVGLYGVIAFTVSRSTQEFGIRMALGAQSRDILKAVLRQGALLVGIGLGIGLVGALLVSQLLSGMLHDVQPLNAPIILGASLVLLVVSLLATYIPARRASRLDPKNALRLD